MTKENRHKLIIEIIRQEYVTNQTLLLDLLTAKGYDITQATLSRDIKELKIIKAPSPNGEYIYQVTENRTAGNDDLSRNPGFKFISIEFSGNLAVAKTRPGYAMALAGEIDKESKDCILGTVAGDDTILLIPKENMSRDEVLAALSLFLPNHFR